MVVGTCKVTLHLAESHSLKEKRQVLKSIISRVRPKFNVSIAEVKDQDLWQRATLGIAVVATDGQHADEVLSKVVSLIARTRMDGEVTDYETELLPVS